MLSDTDISGVYAVVALLLILCCPIAASVLLHRTRVGRASPFHWFQVLHAALFPMAVVFAMIVAPRITAGHEQPELAIFHAILALGLFGTISSIASARGPWWAPALHFVIHLGTFALAIVCWVVGMMSLRPG